MSRSPVIDVDALVAPVPGAQPAGVSLRYEPIYDDIKATRRVAEEAPGEAAPWRKIAELATKGCARSKDLQLGIWLLEALTRLHGFNGASAGIAVLRRFLDDFWETVYPEIDPEDADPLSYRRALLHWLDDRLPVILRAAPITGSASGYGLVHYEATLKTGAERKALDETVWPTADTFQKALDTTDVASLQQTLDEMSACVTALGELQLVVDQRFVAEGAGAPPGARHESVSFVHLKEVLETGTWLLQRALERRQPKTISDPPPGGGDSPGGGPESRQLHAGHADSGWDEALQLVRESRVEGFRLLQAQLASSTSGREQFLRQLQLAELSLEAGVYSLAFPVFDELMRTIDVRKLEEWEDRALIIRVMTGLVRCCALVKALSPDVASRESEIQGRLTQLTEAQATS